MATFMSTFLFIVCLQTPPEPVVTLPATVKAKPGRLVQINATTNGKVIKWFKVSDECDLIVVDSGKNAIFSAPSPGTYRVYAYTALADVPSEPKLCEIIVGDGRPDEEDKKPPKPNPDITKDPLLEPLQSIYGALKTNDSAAKKSILSGIYKKAAGVAQNTAIKTVDQLYGTIRTDSAKALSDSDLLPLRERLAEEIGNVLPSASGTVLTQEHRDAAAKFFNRVADILEAIR